MELRPDIRREAVSLTNVSVAYTGSDRPAIRDITISIPLGKLVVVTGPNGAGKTTLIETCLGLLKPVKGVAKLLGVDTRSRSIVKIRRFCSYVPQDFMRPPHDHYTAYQVISMGLAQLSGYSDRDGRITAIAGKLGIEELLDKPIGMLSGGEQQRVFIARALVRKPRVLFLDEPFSCIDTGSRRLVAETIYEYVEREGATAVIVSHELSPLQGLADALIKMDSGRVTEIRGL